MIENAFYHLKHSLHVPPRHDELAGNVLSAVALATAVAFWL